MAGRFARFSRIFIGLIAFFALLPAFSAASQILDPRGSFRIPLFLALYFGEGWVAVLIHELGHVFAARMAGRRIHVISVRPIAYLVKRRRFVWSPKEGGGDIGGFVLATPKPREDWQHAEIIIALGGVLANLASSAIAFVTLTTRLMPRGEPFVGTFAVLSLVLAVLNLVPIWGPSVERSDGAAFLDAIRGRQNVRRDRLAQLAASHIDGVPPTEWDPALVGEVEADAKNDPALEVAYSLLFVRYFALGEFGRARAMLAPIASPYPDAPVWMKIAEAFFLATIDRNAVEALKKLDRIPRRQRDFGYWRALAIARELMDDRNGVVAAVGEARKAAARSKILLDSDDLTLLSDLERKAKMPPLKEEGKAHHTPHTSTTLST